VALDIKGVNTKIPAHYHLAIGAVTIAFMGLFYEMLPFMGRRLWSLRLARIQPYLYSAGVVLFAVGLYVAGYFGVQRKVYAGEQHLKSLGEYAGMGIMGFGGLVAILGGLFFVINALTSLLKRGEDEAYR
ncbi:MAG: cbb3-type cytochrome c oxidase subunit I, partial [Deltaproteobacteria bacterium]